MARAIVKVMARTLASTITRTKATSAATRITRLVNNV
jgi:hypothetical protein